MNSSSPGVLRAADGTRFIDADDKSLTLFFQGGEKGAYQAIYMRYSPRVRSLCQRMLGHSEDAQEASQEAFLRVFTGLRTFNGRYELGAWITRIATNVCLDQLRARKRRPLDIVPVEDELASCLGFEGLEGDPETHLLQQGESRKVRKVLAGLPPLHRAAIILRDYEGLSYNEVSVALGISEGQVKALIHRARQNFKRSWVSSSLAAVLPVRFVIRLRALGAGRKADTARLGASPQVAEVASSVTPIATSCSAFVQQCGALVTERLATVIAVVVVGGAGVGLGATVNSNPPASRAEPRPTVEAQRILFGSPRAPDRRPESAKDKAEDEVAVASSEPSPQPPAPVPSIEPVPEEEPDSKPKEEPVLAPAPPAGFAPSIGFDRGAPIAGAAPTSNDVSLDCPGRSFSQTLATDHFADGEMSYPARLEVMVEGSEARIGFTIWKDSHDYQYTSWGGSPIVEWGSDGSLAMLQISGSYGASYGYAPENANLPKSGTFALRLQLDCAAFSLVTESVQFMVQ